MGHIRRGARPRHRLRCASRAATCIRDLNHVWAQVFRWIATGFGTIAVIAGLIGLITGSAHALEILVVVTIAWLATGIFWHVLTIGSERSDEPS